MTSNLGVGLSADLRFYAQQHMSAGQPLMLKAADDLERLTADYEKCRIYYEAVKVERDRLRAALVDLLSWLPPVDMCRDYSNDGRSAAIRRAHEALAGGSGHSDSALAGGQRHSDELSGGVLNCSICHQIGEHFTWCPYYQGPIPPPGPL